MTDARKLFEELQQVLEANVKELEELRALKERLNEISSQNACNIVKLNVGGTLFSTSSKTLAEIPNSLLAGMVGQAVPVQTQPDGSIFIDRSPQYFPYILDFYRKKGAVNISRLRPDEIEDLLEEATYFNLTDFVNLLSGKSEAPLEKTSIPQLPPPPSDTLNFMTDATLAATAAAPPAPSSSFERSASPLIAPSEVLGSDSASSSPVVTQRRPATLMRNGAPRPNGMAAAPTAPLAAPSASGSFYPDNYNPQEASAPFKTIRPSADFAAPKPPEPMLPPTTAAVAGGIALGAQSGYPNAPPAPQPSSSSSPGMYNLPPSSGSGAILPPPPGYGVAAKPSYPAPPPSYPDSGAMYGAGNLPPPPAYASAVPLMKKQQMPPPPPGAPGSAGAPPPPMYGAGNLPPPPAYASAVPSMKQQPPPPSYGSGMMMGSRRGAPNPYGMGMGMGMGRGPVEQKAIWKCDMNPNITIQGNMVLKAPKNMSAIVYSPLKTFSRGNHTFTVEIDYSDGKASIGVTTKAALDRFRAKFDSLNPILQTREMEKYKFIGMDEEEWGIQESAYFYNSGTRYDTNQATWRKGSHITYNIRIDADIGMVEFARGDNRWSQTISRSEVVFIVLAAPGVSYSITG